jgi:hypothetical protein
MTEYLRLLDATTKLSYELRQRQETTADAMEAKRIAFRLDRLQRFARYVRLCRQFNHDGGVPADD